MASLDPKKALATILQKIISEELDFSALSAGVRELKNYLCHLSNFNENSAENNQHIYLPTGKAIGPFWAAFCIDDLMRTRQFMHGVMKAVEAAKVQATLGPVHVLYTGPGPFATLILPLLTIYKPTEIQISFVEINEHTINALHATIDGLAAKEYVRDIYHADAAVFKLPSPSDVNVLVVECLQKALISEPQVAITYNLLLQLNPNAILVPQEISLHLALINNKKKMEYSLIADGRRRQDFFINSQAVFTLSKEQVLQHRALSSTGLIFPEREVFFSQDTWTENDAVAINTEITLFDDIALTMDECSLTLPLIIADLNNQENLQGFKTQYIVSEKPGLEVSMFSR